MAGVQKLNHAVLYVADVARSVQFYGEHLGFQVVHQMGDRAAFLRAENSPNDHDLGLFGIGARPHSAASESRPGQPDIGLYHLAWQVDTIEELAALRHQLIAANALVGESDHGVSKSLYAKDPDGIEFEVMWAIPKSHWAAAQVGVERLDLERELAQWAATPTVHEINFPPPD